MVVRIKFTPSWVATCFSALECCERFERQWSAAPRLWARVVSAATLSLVFCATFTADVPIVPVKRTKLLKSHLAPKPDPRAAHLGKLFRIYNCPEPHHIREYLRAADGYGLDYRLLPAVSIRETTCGVEERQNNRWGYHPGRQSFPSVEAGIDYVARQLAENPLYKGKTLEGKLFTYNPRAEYPGEVERIMRQAE